MACSPRQAEPAPLRLACGLGARAARLGRQAGFGSNGLHHVRDLDLVAGHGREHVVDGLLSESAGAPS